MFGDAGQHAWTDFVIVAKSENIVRPTHTNPKQGGQHIPGLRRRPLAHDITVLLSILPRIMYPTIGESICPHVLVSWREVC